MTKTDEVTITTHKSYGSVWKPGELIAGWEELNGGQFSVYLCTKERVLGQRGAVKQRAESVGITGPTWEGVCGAVEDLGFERPTLTEQQVRDGWRP